MWFWDRNRAKCDPERDIKEMSAECDFIFFCVPSTGLRDAALKIRGCVSPEKPLVVLAKGLESGSNKTSDAVLKDIFPGNPVVVFGGPMLAEELLAGKDALGVLGSIDPGAIKTVRELFKGTRVIVETTDDATGLAFCGVLKNIYSLSFGFAEALGEESNIKGLLATDALKEMVEIIPMLGGRKETVMGPGGLGDLIASGTSAYGYNRKVGKEILAKGKTDLVSEGALSLGPIANLLGDRIKKFPLLILVRDILANPATGKELFREYIAGK